MNLSQLQSLPYRLRYNVVVRNIAAGQRLFRQGDRATDLFIIQQGRFKYISHVNDHKFTTIQLLTSGDSLGEISLFFDTYLSTAIAQTNGSVIAYPKTVLLEAISSEPELQEQLLQLLCQRIHDLQLRVRWRDIKASHKRIFHYLQHQAFINNSQIIDLEFPLQDIALELGFAPETLSRALTKLEQAGSIKREQDLIILQNFSAA